MQWKYLMVRLWWSEVTIAQERWRTRARRQIYKSRKRYEKSWNCNIYKGVARMTTQIQHMCRSMRNVLQGGDPDIVHWNLWLYAWLCVFLIHVWFIIRRLIFTVTTNKWLKFPARVCPNQNILLLRQYICMKLSWRSIYHACFLWYSACLGRLIIVSHIGLHQLQISLGWFIHCCAERKHHSAQHNKSVETTTEQYTRETVTHHVWRVQADTKSSNTNVDTETKLLPPQVYFSFCC
jgi:hypothetical protein